MAPATTATPPAVTIRNIYGPNLTVARGGYLQTLIFVTIKLSAIQQQAGLYVDISSAKSGWSGLVSFAPSMCQVYYDYPRCFQMMFLQQSQMVSLRK